MFSTSLLVVTAESFAQTRPVDVPDPTKDEKIQTDELEANRKSGNLAGQADNLYNLGIVLQTRGDLDRAETMYRKALAIHEKLDLPEGMAGDYGNLGNVLHARGDLDGAETMYRKALAIDEKLGRLEGMAIQYTNLGILLRARGDFDGARREGTKSRDLFAKLGAKHTVEKLQVWLDELPR
jgi:tetratricopeptide (TPR) repeat protein